MAGNSDRAHGVAVEAFDGGLSLIDLLDDVLAPALCVVGERWQEGLVRHTQERIATAAAESLLERLTARTARADAPLWLVATVRGDDHRIGVRMTAATLADAGLRVRAAYGLYPADLVAEAPALAGLCLSCSGPWSVVDARASATRVAAAGTPVLLGGRGWGEWEGAAGITRVPSMAALAALAARQTTTA